MSVVGYILLLLDHGKPLSASTSSAHRDRTGPASGAVAVSIGVLGCGSIGLRHVRNALAAGLFVTAFDPSRERVALAEAAGAKVASGPDDLLAGRDLALIATPSGQHARDLLRALDHDCHVLVEKPFVTTVEPGLVERIEQACKAGRVVAAAMNMRFNPCVQGARRAFREHDLGRPVWARFTAASYLPDWRPGQDYRTGYAADAATGGAIFDFTHEIDLAVHLLGEARLLGGFPHRSGRLELASEDLADLVVEHAGGCRTTIHMDYLTRPRRRGFEIAFANGFVVADLERGRLDVWSAEGRPIEGCDMLADHNDTYVQMLRGFVGRITGSGGKICAASEALSVSALAIAARTARTV